MAKVVIYTSANCPYCVNAKALLERKGVKYEEIRIDSEPTRLQEMIERSGRRTVPQIFINHQAVGGFDDIAKLEREGKLEELLEQPYPEEK